MTVLEMFTIMPQDDPELVDVVRRQLTGEGVDIQEGVDVKSARKTSSDISVTVQDRENGGPERTIEGSRILVAAGRRANVQGLDLEKAGIAYSDKGIEVDARLRTTNKRAVAIGDVIGGLQ